MTKKRPNAGGNGGVGGGEGGIINRSNAGANEHCPEKVWTF